MCSPSWETHIPSNICSPSWETHVPSDMCYVSETLFVSHKVVIQSSASNISICIANKDAQSALVTKVRQLAFIAIILTYLLCIM